MSLFKFGFAKAPTTPPGGGPALAASGAGAGSGAAAGRAAGKPAVLVQQSSAVRVDVSDDEDDAALVQAAQVAEAAAALAAQGKRKASAEPASALEVGEEEAELFAAPRGVQVLNGTRKTLPPSKQARVVDSDEEAAAASARKRKDTGTSKSKREGKGKGKGRSGARRGASDESESSAEEEEEDEDASSAGSSASGSDVSLASSSDEEAAKHKRRKGKVLRKKTGSKKRKVVDSDDEDASESEAASVSASASASASAPAKKQFLLSLNSGGAASSAISGSLSSSKAPGKTPAKTPAKGAASAQATPQTGSSSGKKSPADKSPLDGEEGGGGEDGAEGGQKGMLYGAGEHEHDSLPWLRAEGVRDAKGRRPEDPDYDGGSLQVPASWLKDKTQAKKDWWEFKKQLFDTVLFFKVGKFYEIFHADADLACKHTGLIYMKGLEAHSGFPEKAYAKFSDELVSRGYKVARVEQTETPAMAAERTGKKSNIVRRELCGIISRGTRTLDVRDDVEKLEASPNESVQLVALFETALEGPGGRVVVGACVMDSTTGRFRVCQFEDAANRARLRMLLARESPAEICFASRALTGATLAMLRQGWPQVLGCVGTCVHSPVWGEVGDARGEAAAALAALRDPKLAYFAKDAPLPAALAALEQAPGTPRPGGADALAALNLALRLLRRCKIDQRLVSMGVFEEYELPGAAAEAAAGAQPPPQQQGSAEQPPPQQQQQRDRDAGRKMVLDSQAIFNLDLVSSSSGINSMSASGEASRSTDGSLLAFLDRTVTKFGKRHLKEWVAAPLLSASEIRARQAKVAALVTLLEWRPEALNDFRQEAKRMADMERSLQRVHSMGAKDPGHPDARAVLYELSSLNKNKIVCLLDTLQSARYALSVLDKLAGAVRALAAEHAEAAAALQPLCSAPTREWQRVLDNFARSFDDKAARLTGSIEPTPGMSKEFDDAVAAVEAARAGFAPELDAVRAHFKGVGNAAEIKWYHPAAGKDLFQIEVPATLLAKRALPGAYMMKTKTKSVTRYHTAGIMQRLTKFSLAEAHLSETRGGTTRLVFEAFDRDRAIWSRLVAMIAELDCLQSLARVSANSSPSSPMCRPEILDGGGATLELVAAQHPCVAQALERAGKSYVPNDLRVGGAGAPSCMLLTGPNMGGKSSLCRQTAVATVMAQIGCFVNAERCRLSPVDRVFTRLGASDFIMSGKSTFFVELDETATVLHNATERSLVILDELGRGTSTHDGAAIAFAVVEHLTELGARTIFATHYHALVEDFARHPRVKTAHMACRAAALAPGAAPAQANLDVTFLYKLADGPSDKSHGLNVARLADLPESIIETARRESGKFEKDFLAEQLYTEICRAVAAGAPRQELERLHKRAKLITAMTAQ